MSLNFVLLSSCRMVAFPMVNSSDDHSIVSAVVVDGGDCEEPALRDAVSSELVVCSRAATAPTSKVVASITACDCPRTAQYRVSARVFLFGSWVEVRV